MRSLTWLILCLLLAHAHPALGQAGDPASSAVSLRPGDAIRIDVWRDEEMSGEFVVGADGGLMHPLYQGVQVSGLPLDEVRAKVLELVRSYHDAPEVLIQPLVRVTVAGEVTAPLVYQLEPGLTLVDAVTAAGGTTRAARLDRVLLTRDGDRRAVDLSDASSQELTVRSGDHIYVERRRTAREYLDAASYVVNTATFFFGVYLAFFAN